VRETARHTARQNRMPGFPKPDFSLFIVYHLHFISDPDPSTVNYSGKHTFSGHNAFSHLPEDLASVVALLSDLGHLQYYIITLETCPDRKRPEVNSLHNKVFPESAVFYLSAPGAEFFNLILRKKTDLPMPFPG